MPFMHRARPTGVIAICLALLACEQVFDPSSTEPPELFQNGTVADAASQLSDGDAAFAVITLSGEGLLARKIRLSPPSDREAIVARVAAVTTAGAGGSITLVTGGIAVAFDEHTTFTVGEGEAVEPEIAVARLRAALDDGHHPWIEAARPAPSSPQAADAKAFLAAAIRLGEADAPEFRLNVDADNLVRNASPPPDGWVAVLGLRVEVRVSEGLTVIVIANDALAKREFSGLVRAVDLDARTVTLEDGTVIQTVTETDLIKHHPTSLRSLEAAQAALDAGLPVAASGIGVVRTEDPLVLVALRLGLAIRAELEEFHGPVAAIDVDARTVTLANGLVIRLFVGTVLMHGDDPVRFRSLAAAAEALKAGHGVIAAGVGVALDDESLLALRLMLARALRPFEGLVVAVDLTARTVTLEDGTVVLVPESSDGIQRAPSEDDRVILKSLEDVAEALEAGRQVLAAGVGTLQAEEPVTITAVKIVFFLKPPPLHRFEGVVTAVNLDGRHVDLEGGARIRVPSDEVIAEADGDHPLATLAAVAEAVAAGKKVVAHGVGELETEEPRVLVAVKVLFAVAPPGLTRFEGKVASVNLSAQTLILASGTVIRVTADTKIHQPTMGTILASLEAVAEALARGVSVSAVGAGVLESEGPRTILAVEMAFYATQPVFVFFEGTVTAVDLEARTVTLDGERVLHLTEASQIVVNDHALPSLRAVADAIAAGKTVVAAGVAEPAAGGGEKVVKVVFVVAG